MRKRQGKEHWLIETEQFYTIEAYIGHLIRQKAYVQAAMLARNKRVLEIGCNTGYGTALLSKTGREVIGVDISGNAIAVAQKQYAASGITFQRIDEGPLPFQESRFDLVVSFQVFEHIINYRQYLTEIYRVLDSQGIVLLTTPNAVLRLDPGMRPWNPFHVRDFSPTALQEILTEVFACVNIYGLFAREPLYSLELHRVTRIRNTVRLLTKILPMGILPLLFDLRRGLRSLSKFFKKPQQAHAVQEQYSVEDIFYQQSDLEQALDLLAICAKNPNVSCDLEDLFRENSIENPPS